MSEHNADLKKKFKLRLTRITAIVSQQLKNLSSGDSKIQYYLLLNPIVDPKEFFKGKYEIEEII